MKWLVGLLVAALLAGCSDEAAPADDEPDLGLEGELEATESTGVIRGVVLDPSIVPIQGATVTLGDGTTVQTNANGGFGFSNLEPGTYFLDITKLGFTPTQTSAEVEAGVDLPPVVKVQLVPDASSAPYVQAFQFDGYMACSLSYIALCGLPVVDETTEDNFLATFELDGPPDWINMEATWRGTQPTGNQFNMNMGRTPAGPDTTCCTAQGPSPLLITANATTIAEGGIGTEGDLVHRMFAWEMEGTGIDDHTGQCVPVVLTTYCQGPGVALDQNYQVYVHAFYHFVPPEGYRFTEDGAPTLPT
ncbi:MAG: carboxypeptidase-like regulatory domain-containing protein [Thermoplasmatota archaeon]